MFIDLDYKIVYIYGKEYIGKLTYRFNSSIECGKYEHKRLCFDFENYPLKYNWGDLFQSDYQPLLTEMYY